MKLTKEDFKDFFLMMALVFVVFATVKLSDYAFIEGLVMGLAMAIYGRYNSINGYKRGVNAMVDTAKEAYQESSELADEAVKALDAANSLRKEALRTLEETRKVAQNGY